MILDTQSRAYALKSLFDSAAELGDTTKRWSKLSLEDFIFVCWAKRGYVGEKSTKDIAALYRYGTTHLLDFASRKVLGWKNMAALAKYSGDAQRGFVNWYLYNREDERQELAESGISVSNKDMLNAYFARNEIRIVVK